MTDDTNVYEELSEGEPTTSKRKKALEAGRECPTCGKEGRVHSGNRGVRGYCANCKTDWPISGPITTATTPLPERGLHKRTLIEPNWDLAFEDLEEDEEFNRGE